jgi:hypothetical protein
MGCLAARIDEKNAPLGQIAPTDDAGLAAAIGAAMQYDSGRPHFPARLAGIPSNRLTGFLGRIAPCRQPVFTGFPDAPQSAVNLPMH